MSNRTASNLPVKSAVVYCRVSTKEQTQNLSLPTQQSRCIAFCDQNGWAVDRVFRDAGESAKTQDRPEFQGMLAYCKANKGRIGFVVVNDLSRFSRQMEDQVSVIADLEAIGVRLRSVSENVDETAAGKLMRNIYGAFNQFDNDRKAERTKIGMQRSASIGRFPFKAPLGYLNVSAHSGPNLIPDARSAPLVSKAFELYAAGNLTRNEVLRRITALGLRTRKDKPLTPQSFDKLLRNPIYTGYVCIPSWGFKQKGGFEPLVSEEIFKRVQDLLDGIRPSATPHYRNNPDFPLRVFVRCGVCDEGLTGAWSKGRNKRYPYYRCRTATCKSVNIRREKLEQQFVFLIERLTPQQALMRLFIEAVKHVWEQKQQDSQDMLRAATERLAKLADRKNKLVDANLDGRIDQQTYEEQIERLRGDIEQAESELHYAEVENLDVDAVLEFAERLVRKPAQVWLNGSVDQKQRLQRVFFPDGLTFTDQGFGTGASNSFFDLLEVYEGKKSNLASLNTQSLNQFSENLHKAEVLCAEISCIFNHMPRIMDAEASLWIAMRINRTKQKKAGTVVSYTPIRM